MYLIAILFPPLAVLLSGRPIQALINVGLCCLLWIPGIIHAIMVVSDRKAEKRNDKMIRAMVRAQR